MVEKLQAKESMLKNYFSPISWQILKNIDNTLSWGGSHTLVGINMLQTPWNELSDI